MERLVGAEGAGIRPAAWQLIGPSKATYPARAQSVPLRRGAIRRERPRHGDGDRADLHARASAALRRRGRRRRLEDRRTRSPGARTGSSCPAASAPTRSARCSSIRAIRRGKTLYAGTGEPNASGDSEAGVGIYKTTDGGQTWTLVPGSDIFFQRRDRADGLRQRRQPAGSDRQRRARRQLGHERRVVERRNRASARHPRPLPADRRHVHAHPADRRRGDGSRFDDRQGRSDASRRHLRQRVLAQGIWRSLDNGATWTQIKTPLNAGAAAPTAPSSPSRRCPTATRGCTSASATSPTRARTGRGSIAPTTPRALPVFTDMTTSQNIDYCTGQCWYDNVVYTPAGAPDVVYLGGSFDYGQLHAAVERPRLCCCRPMAAATWSDLTQDGDPDHAEVHPSGPARDRHACPASRCSSSTGSDGGVVRSDGKFADVSAKCDTRGLSAADTAFCKSLLIRVAEPARQHEQRACRRCSSRACRSSPQRPQNLLQGGTQDNGTFQYNGSRDRLAAGSSTATAASPASTPRNDALRFNTFTGQANDANFRNGDPTKWVIISAPIVSSPEASFFYPPIIADPQPGHGGLDLPGLVHRVWRTQDWGGNQALPRSQLPRVHDVRRRSPAAVTSSRSATARPIDRISTSRRPAVRQPGRRRRRLDRSVRRQTPARCGPRRAPAACSSPTTRTPRPPRSSGRGSTRSRRTIPAAFDQRDPRRSGERASCVDLVLGLQRQHAGAAGPRVRGDLERIGRGDLGRSQLQPARPSRSRPSVATT